MSNDGQIVLAKAAFQLGAAHSVLNDLEKNSWAMNILGENGFSQKDINEAQEILLKFRTAIWKSDSPELFDKGVEINKNNFNTVNDQEKTNDSENGNGKA